MDEKADTHDSPVETDKRLASALRRLTIRCRDSAAGYRAAAEETDHESLKFEFEQMADERSRLSETLESLAKELGVEANQDDDIISDAHDAFVKFKSRLLSGDPKAILDEVARGEAAFERVFDDVLGLHMPKAARRALQVQHRTVLQARDYYKSLARKLRRRRDAAISDIKTTRAGSHLHRHPVAAVAVVVASALVIGTVAILSRQERPQLNINKPSLRNIEKRLRKLEDRGLRQLGKYRGGLEKRAHRGLEKFTRGFGSHR